MLQQLLGHEMFPGQNQWREKENEPDSFRYRLFTCRPCVCAEYLCTKCWHWAHVSSLPWLWVCRGCVRASAPGLRGVFGGWVHSQYRLWVCGSLWGCGGWMGMSSLLGWEDMRSHCKEFWQLFSSAFILASTSEFGLGDYSSQTRKEGKDVVDNPYIPVDHKDNMFFPFGSPCSGFDIILKNKRFDIFCKQYFDPPFSGEHPTEGTLAI